jgi:Lrp/AsnC family transcriptional regulator
MMKVQVADMTRFDHFYKKLVNSVPSLNNVTSAFVMEELKYTTALPIG